MRLQRIVTETLDSATRMGAPRAIALCRNFGGALAFRAGRFEEAERSLREAAELSCQLGSSSGESSAQHRLAAVLIARGRLEEATRALEDALVIAESAMLRAHLMTRIFALLARTSLAAGELDAADEHVRRGRVAAERHGRCVSCNALLLPEAVRVDLARGRTDQAERAVEQLETLADKYRSQAWTSMARHARGRHRLAQKDLPRARAALLDAEAAYRGYGDVYELARCQVARALATEGPEAAQLDREAREALSALGSPFVEGEAAGAI